MPEPISHKSACTYCGDAAVNHRATFIEGCIATVTDPWITTVAHHAPSFFSRLVDHFIEGLVVFLSFLKIATFSEDIDKALSFRSKVIWEEAERRGIRMEQVVFLGKLFEFYRAKINGKWVYFQSLPVPPELLRDSDKWDDKIALKRALSKANIPTPRFAELAFFSRVRPEKLFARLGNTLIVKPRVGSRGRHTTTNITTPEMLRDAVRVGKMISPRLAVEEHIVGYVCRATVVDGTLAGFYRAGAPYVVGDGIHTIAELIEEKNKLRHERVEAITLSAEMHEYITRAGYTLHSILEKDTELPLTHRTGRFYGGTTKEMIDELHPSFVAPIIEAARVLNLSVVGFDVIVPDPTKDAASQRWGIIESNTLPFIDLHYYALEGTTKNIAGMIWDLWEKKNL